MKSEENNPSFFADENVMFAGECVKLELRRPSRPLLLKTRAPVGEEKESPKLYSPSALLKVF